MALVLAACAASGGAVRLGAAASPQSKPLAQPWGLLDVAPLMITPPREYVPQDSELPVTPTDWHFPGADRRDVEKALLAAGAPAADAARLAAGATIDPKVEGLLVQPDEAFVRSLSPAVRAKLYFELVQSPANFDQTSAYYFRIESGQSDAEALAKWLGPDIPPATREAVAPFAYRINNFLYVADIELVRRQIGTGANFQQLVRRLLRQQAMFVSLRIENPDNVEALADYWGKGGRRTDIMPLLQLIADAGPTRTLNISELLPELPRRLLYRYPKVTLEDLSKPQLANCFWTALNFFNETADDKYLDPIQAMDALRRDYYIVHDNLQLGDIAVFSTREMNVFHVASYLANGLVFTKNGAFSLAPWTILPVEELKGAYVGHTKNWLVTYYRKKTL